MLIASDARQCKRACHAAWLNLHLSLVQPFPRKAKHGSVLAGEGKTVLRNSRLDGLPPRLDRDACCGACCDTCLLVADVDGRGGSVKMMRVTGHESISWFPAPQFLQSRLLPGPRANANMLTMIRGMMGGGKGQRGVLVW